MARASTTELNQALVTTGMAWLSLHTADPGTTGANECSGGSYARQSVTWAAPSGGSVATSNAQNVPVNTGQTALYFGLWSAASAGTYYIGGALSSSAVGPTTATFAIGAVTVTAA